MSLATMPDLGVEPDPLPHELPENRGRYSLGRAFRMLCDTKREKLDGLEGEVSQEIERRSGPSVSLGPGDRSFRLPWTAEVRSVDTTAAAGGIATIVKRPVIDVLRAKLVTARLGAVTLPDLRGGGDAAIPRRTATATLTYVGEGVAPASSNPVIGSQAVVYPFTVGAYSDASRKYYVTVPDAEALLMEDLALATAHDIDRCALNGAASVTNEPIGLFQMGIQQFSWGTNGGAPTHAGLCEMERMIGDANAEVGPLGFLSSPSGRSKLRRTEVTAGTGRLLWRSDDRLSNGVPALATTLCPSNLIHGSGTALSASIMGDFSSLVIGLWGPPTIVINPYLWASTGLIRTTYLTDYGVTFRHVQSFAVAPDMVTT